MFLLYFYYYSKCESARMTGTKISQIFIVELHHGADMTNIAKYTSFYKTSKRPC